MHGLLLPRQRTYLFILIPYSLYLYILSWHITPFLIPTLHSLSAPWMHPPPLMVPSLMPYQPRGDLLPSLETPQLLLSPKHLPPPPQAISFQKALCPQNPPSVFCSSPPSPCTLPPHGILPTLTISPFLSSPQHPPSNSLQPAQALNSCRCAPLPYPAKGTYLEKGKWAPRCLRTQRAVSPSSKFIFEPTWSLLHLLKAYEKELEVVFWGSCSGKTQCTYIYICSFPVPGITEVFPGHRQLLLDCFWFMQHPLSAPSHVPTPLFPLVCARQSVRKAWTGVCPSILP